MTAGYKPGSDLGAGKHLRLGLRDFGHWDQKQNRVPRTRPVCITTSFILLPSLGSQKSGLNVTADDDLWLLRRCEPLAGALLFAVRL